MYRAHFVLIDVKGHRYGKARLSKGLPEELRSSLNSLYMTGATVTTYQSEPGIQVRSRFAYDFGTAMRLVISFCQVHPEREFSPRVRFPNAKSAARALREGIIA